MSIRIRHPHSKPHEEALRLAQEVADEMKAEFGIESSWSGEVLHFQRSGVNGTLTISPSEILIEAKLGLLLAALKPKIEKEIQRFLDERFDG
jgi:putative polyhydroxyalkanoate system protein